MSYLVFDKIKLFLDSFGVKYEVFEHEDASTSEIASKVREELWGVSAGRLIKSSMKALIVRSEGKFYQFILPGNRKLDFRKVRRILDSNSVSLATHVEVEKAVDCVPGEVPPLANLFGISVYVDFSLTNFDFINFTAGLKTITIRMRYKDWFKAIEPVEEDFSKDL